MTADDPTPVNLAALDRGRTRDHDQPLGLILHARLAPKLQALYADQVNSRRGAERANASERPTPMSSALMDTQRATERLIGYLDHVVTHVVTGGDSVIRVSGWWGMILCPACGQDTLLHDLGEQRVSCTDPDCADDDGQPWWRTERWLYGRIGGLDAPGETDEGFTTQERQRRRIAEQDGQIAYLQQRLDEADTLLDLHGLEVGA